MARHYSEAWTVEGDRLDIPTPAVDMGSNQVRFGTSGSFVSGGGYVRKSVFGAKALDIAWNNLDTDDTAAIRSLEEAGPFVWDNPMNHANVAPPWLANHGAVTKQQHDKLGLSRSAYFLQGEGITPLDDPWESDYHFKSYPTIGGQSVGASYEFDSVNSAQLFSFVVPQGFRAHVVGVGERSGTSALRLHAVGSTGTINLNTPNSNSGDNYPVSSTTTPKSRHGVATIMAQGTGYLWLSSLIIRIFHEDDPVPSGYGRRYTPGMGNSELEFSEEGIQFVQHSAALDLRSATARWLETGWWK